MTIMVMTEYRIATSRGVAYLDKLGEQLTVHRIG